MNKNVQNFGKLKNVYNNILVESITSKKDDNKSLFKKYIKTIKSDKILKEQFLIYNNIENKIESDRFKATEYVKESIALLTKYPKSEILESNVKLVADVAFEFDTDYDKKELHEAITTLIFTDKNASTLDAIMEATDKVVTYIMNNKPREISESYGVPNSMLLSVTTDKFNEEYADLTESEKEVLETLLESNLEKKEILFKQFNDECLELVNNRLQESDINAKDKLLSVKERLLDNKFNEETYIKDINKLIELKNTLKN